MLDTAKRLGNTRSVFNTVKKNYVGWLIMLPSVLLLYYIVWRPIFVGAWQSLFQLEGYTPVKFVGLKNYVDVITDTVFFTTLKNTFAYVGWSLVFGYLLPVIAAIMVNEMVHFKEFFKVSMYFPIVIPSVAVSLIWYYLYLPGQDGVLNAVLSLFGIAPLAWLQDKNLTKMLIVISNVWNSFGATMIMYLASLQSVNQELYEAARIDGAGVWQRIKTVLIPHLRPLMMLLFVKQIIGVFQIMEQPLVMTGGGPNNASISIALRGYLYAFAHYQMDKAMAVGVITFFILVAVTWVYFILEKKMEA